MAKPGARPHFSDSDDKKWGAGRALPAVELVHRGIHAVDEDRLDRVGRFLDGDGHLLTGALAEPAQHVVGALLLGPRLADTDPNAHEPVVVQVLLDRAQ